MKKNIIITGMVITFMAAGLSACRKESQNEKEAIVKMTVVSTDETELRTKYDSDKKGIAPMSLETQPISVEIVTPILETEPIPIETAAPTLETEPAPVETAAPTPETEPIPIETAAPTPETEPVSIETAAPTPETQPVPIETEAVTLFSQDEAKIQYDMIDYVNSARRNAGLKEYGWDSSLEEGCKIRAKELAQSFSHTRLDGTGDETAFPKNILANIAQGTLYNSKSAFDCWMSSEGHKALILRGSTEDIVVSVDNLWNDEKGEFYKKGDVIKGQTGNMCCASYNGNWFMCVAFSN